MSEAFGRAAHLLSITFSSPNDGERRQAEEELRILSQDTKGFFQFLLALISSSETQQSLRTSAATRLRNFMRESIEASKLTTEDRMYLSEMIFQAVISPNIDRSTRGIINLALNPLIADDSMGVCSSRLAALAVVALKGEAYQIYGSLSVTKSLFSCMGTQFPAQDYLKILLPNLVEVGNKSIFHLHAALQSSNEELAIETLYIMEEWTACIRQILEHFETVTNKGIREFIEHTELASIFTSIVILKIPDWKLPDLQSTINIASSTVTVSLNQIKANLIKSINIILQYLIDSKKKTYEEQGNNVITTIGASIPDHPFVNTASNILEPLIQSLLVICVHPELESLIVQSYLSELVIETLNFLHKCVSETQFYGVFESYHKQIIIDIVFQLLKLNEIDKESFINSPDEFVNNGQDICERQESETTKTTSAQLLETMCDCIDGSLAYTTNLALQLIEMTTNSKQAADFYVLKEIENSLFMKSDDITKLEISFVILSILSFAIQRRKDLLTQLDNILEKNTSTLFSVSSMVIHSRICLFLYFYTENIFKDRENSFKTWMLYLSNCVSQSQSRAVTIQACETISYIFQDEEVMYRLEPFITELVSVLINSVASQTEKSFFEALIEIVQNYSDALTGKIGVLMVALVQKIQQEFQLQVTANKKDSIIITKSWNIIRSLITSSKLITNDLLEFERLLLPLINYIQNPESVSFIDDIFGVILLIMKKTKSISALQWEIFPFLSSLQLKQENSLNTIFKILTLYVLYGKDSLVNAPQKLSLIVDMAGRSLFAQPKGKIREALNSEGAILYQLLLQMFSGILDHFLEKILSDVLTRYAQTQTNGFFKARLLGVVLSAFAYNSTLTSNILSNSNTNESITFLRYSIQEILRNYSLFAHVYDKKVSVIGLCSLFMTPNYPQDVFDNIIQIFDALIAILSNKPVVKEEAHKHKSPIDMLMENLFDSEDDDFDTEIFVKGTKLLYGDTEGLQEKREENEANLCLAALNSPINFIDEYSVFKNMVSSLSSTNKEFLINLTKNISPQRGQELVQIIQSKRVQINDLPGENTEIRKIVKVKHKKH